MTYTSGDLKTASLHVTAAEVRIEGQRRLIARFRRLGYGTTEELELLTDFVETRLFRLDWSPPDRGRDRCVRRRSDSAGV